MPEIPDLETYLHALRSRIVGRTLERVRLASPFLLRSVEPPLERSFGLRVESLRRLGKRIVIVLEGDVFLVLHLMIAGRLAWRPSPAAIPKRSGLAAFDFAAVDSSESSAVGRDADSGTLILTEAGSKKRASLHVVTGEKELARHDPGGIEPLGATRDMLRQALIAESHTVKRALTDPRIFSGIGNTYSDEILHRARLSPFKRTTALDDDELARLHRAMHDVLEEWTRRLMTETGDGFPRKVTAFRPEMAVHGRHDMPCPTCDAPVQRVLYANSEFNYCPGCQTGGKILADRVLSRLLKEDWPRTVEDLEHRTAEPGGRGTGR